MAMSVLGGRGGGRGQWAFVFESMYSNVYGVKWSLWGVPIGSFLNFSKILIFWRFWVKIDLGEGGEGEE